MSKDFGRFDNAVQTANLWLGELERQLGLQSRDQAYVLLRAVLHTLRDRLPWVEAVQLGGQLPTLIRGIYYDGWSLRRSGERLSSMTAFVDRVMAAMHPAMVRLPEAAVLGVFALLGQHVSAGEIEDVRRCLPDDVQAHWPAEQPAGGH
jgi:uncharacterized protein (DUF2267 family)